MEERLQKLLSARGIVSRRKAEEWITAGRVQVNGVRASLGTKADPDRDEILLDGAPLPMAAEPAYLMLNKPRGFVTTLQDERGRRTVADLVSGCGTRVYPVGRLDQYSEGLLILTNDGDAAYRLAHPKHQVEKTYHVWLSHWTAGALTVLRGPIALAEGTVQAVRVKMLRQTADTAMVELTITQGKNRQIRRMCQAAGVTVTRLRRVSEGELKLGDLKPGQWRHLSPEEVAYLRNL